MYCLGKKLVIAVMTRSIRNKPVIREWFVIRKKCSTFSANNERPSTTRFVRTKSRNNYVSRDETNRPTAKRFTSEQFPEEAESDDEGQFTPFVVKKHSPKYFYNMCVQLASEGKIAECVAVLEKRMREDRVRPEKFNYGIVIHALGRAGQPRKAFEIFKKMRADGFVSSPWIITSMINACANCHSSEAEYAMRQTKWLLQRERHLYGYIHEVMYFAALKCFGRHGDVATVFRLADDMLRDGYLANRRLFDCLLSACIPQRESGFKLALDVWRAMAASKIKPSAHQYRLLLKACGDCGVGEKGNQLLRQITESNKKTVQSRLQLPESSDTDKSDATLNFLSLTEENVENKLLLHAENFEEDSERSLKLALIGGADGLLMNMKKNNVSPDTATLCSLLYLASLNQDVEMKMLDFAKANDVELDLHFFNNLIYRLCCKNDRDSALSLLDEMTKFKLQPDLRTFYGLSFLCKNHEQGLTLIRDMTSYGIKPTLKIYQSLLRRAFVRNNFHYALTVLSQMKKYEVKPDETMFRFIESKLEKARELIWRKENEETDSDKPTVVGYKDFLTFYKTWTRDLDIHYAVDPKLNVFDKKIDTDDLRENWEKPWVKDDEKRRESAELGNIKIVP